VLCITCFAYSFIIIIIIIIIILFLFCSIQLPGILPFFPDSFPIPPGVVSEQLCGSFGCLPG